MEPLPNHNQWEQMVVNIYNENIYNSDTFSTLGLAGIKVQKHIQNN